MTHDIIEDGRNILTAGREWDSGIAFGPVTNTYKLTRSILSAADRIDSDLERIYDAHHIDSATGEDLRKFGELVNVDRQTGESDGRYRARIKANFRASTIGTTFDEFAEFTGSVLSTSLDNVDFLTSYDARPATVDIAADAAVYDDVDLAAGDLSDILGQGVPAGHEVRVLERGTFRLKVDGETDDPDKGLTSDSITSGGTLAADLI